MLRHGVPVWCSLGAERLPYVELPDLVRRIMVFADPDPAGRRAADKVREAHPDREVVVEMPPVLGPEDDRDFADFWEADPTPLPPEFAADPASQAPMMP